MRWVYLIGGWLAIALGALGVVLPLLPTTPFLLLACFCFARSSPRWHEWLMYRSPFAALLQQWHSRRSIPRKAKRRATLFIIVSFAISIIFAPYWWLKVVLTAMAMLLLMIFRRIPVEESSVN